MSTKIITIELLSNASGKGLFDKVIMKVVQKKGKGKEVISSFTAADTDATVSVETIEG
jgi:hypothetical protein